MIQVKTSRKVQIASAAMIAATVTLYTLKFKCIQIKSLIFFSILLIPIYHSIIPQKGNYEILFLSFFTKLFNLSIAVLRLSREYA